MRLLPLLVVVISGASVAACSGGNAIDPDSAAMNDRGVALMGRYEYDAARQLFATVVERESAWPEARVNLAIATLNRQREGDERLALEILQPVLEKNPEHLRALYMRALINLYLGEPELAADDLAAVVEADGTDAYATYFLGQSLLQKGEPAEALQALLRAVELDPYLRSAYYAAAQVSRAQGKADKADALLAGYQRFAANPAARLASFGYRRMGPKGDALAYVDVKSASTPLPSGPLFAEPRTFDGDDWTGATATTVDINDDGRQDLFVSSASRVGVFLLSADGRFVVDAEHPLAAATHLHAALWGDVDDDGKTDLVACGPGGIDVWRQVTGGDWQPRTLSTEDCRGGALFDADHDGDLDILSTGSQGNELLSNNRDGTFRRLADSLGLSGSAGRQVLIADLDADRDLDVLVVNAATPHDAWLNDRTWQYRSFPGLESLRESELLAVTAGDADSDGRVEIYGLTERGELRAWRSDGTAWSRSDVSTLALPASGAEVSAELSIADFDGDGTPELVVAIVGDSGGVRLLNPLTGELLLAGDIEGLQSTLAVAFEPASGPALVAVRAGGLDLWPAGPGRHAFLSIAPSGRSEAGQMRSNASGIGTRIAVNTSGRWTTHRALDPHSGPGQSLAPVSVGLRDRTEAEFVELEWSDGVSQTEIELRAGVLHEITETQRQLASCPVVFTWDGKKYRFVSDVLGVGGLGFFVEPGVYAPPRPFEGYVLDGGSLQARDGRYVVKLTEPMEENAYLDAARLDVYDLPEGWSLVLDERMGINGPPVTGRPITYRRALDPVRATNGKGIDVTETILHKDHRAAPPGIIDHRFIGLLAEDQVLTIEFDTAIGGDGLALLADGWVEYPYSQTVFAAWQAGIRYRSATLEARGDDGDWIPVAVEFGYPAGMPRKMFLPIPDLPPGTRALRLSSNMEIYWDRLQVIWEEPLSSVKTVSLSPVAARVANTGFADRTTGPQRLPHYDYSKRSPYWDAKSQRGFYTVFGDATALVTDVDGAVAIIGGGEEIHLEFPARPAPAPGLRRVFALQFRGWAKDMDLYTQHGDTVGPLPTPDGMSRTDLERRDLLHADYNVRFQEGL